MTRELAIGGVLRNTKPAGSRHMGHLRPHCLGAVVGALLTAAGPAVGADANKDTLPATSSFSPTLPVSLALSFREESWAEVYDASGRRLFYNLGRAGQHLRYDGLPPFRLVLGNARGVDIVVAGESIDTRRYQPGQVKRLVLKPRPQGVEVTSVLITSPSTTAESAAGVVDKPADVPSPSSSSSAHATSQPYGSLELNFREECWVEVHDSAENRLFYDLGRAGRHAHLEGTPPFKLLLGNPAGVEIVFAGETIVTSRYPNGEVKRLVLRPAPRGVEATGGPAGSPEAVAESAADVAIASPDAAESPDNPVVGPDAEARVAAESTSRAGDGSDIGDPPEAPKTPETVVLFDRNREPERSLVRMPSVAEGEAPDDAEREATTAHYPRLLGFADVSAEYNSTFQAADPADESDDWLVGIDSDLEFQMSPRWYLKTNVAIVLNGEDDGLHRFDADYPDQGLYVRELRLQHDAERYSVFGGKYDPAEAIYSYAPVFFGNYSNDFNLEERIGLGGSWFFQKQSGSEIKLSAHAFYVDTSALSGELFGGGARNGINSGDPGDTGKLNNYLVTLHGGSTRPNPGLRYTLGVGLQRSDEPDGLDERAVLESLLYVVPLNSGAELEFSLDLLSLNNAGGEAEDTRSITGGAGYSDWPFFIGVSYSYRYYPQEDNGTDLITELVVSKGIGDSIYVEAAYQRIDEDGMIEKSAGIWLGYSIEWDL